MATLLILSLLTVPRKTGRAQVKSAAALANALPRDRKKRAHPQPEPSALLPVAIKFASSRLAVVLLSLGCLSGLTPAWAANNFIVVQLPQGVQVELPRNWEALSNNQRITLDSTVQSRLERTGDFDASSDLNFAANYYDDAGKVAALMNVRYYPDMDVTQRDSRDAGPADIEELDRALRANLDKAGKEFGFTVLAWKGTRKQVINGTVAFVTEYRRSPIKNGNFVVRLIRVLNGPRSFTLTVSYRESDEFLLRPICDRIISSLRSTT